MTKALVFEPNSPDVLHERGKCLYVIFSFYIVLPISVFISEYLNSLVKEHKVPLTFAINSGIVNFKSKDFTAAVKDLSICLKQEKDNKSAYTYLVRLLSLVILGFQSNHECICFLRKSFLIFSGTSICFSW